MLHMKKILRFLMRCSNILTQHSGLVLLKICLTPHQININIRVLSAAEESLSWALSYNASLELGRTWAKF